MRYISLLLASIGAIVLYQGTAKACFCGPPNFSQSIISAKTIFSGKVVEASPERVVFQVDEVWKGQHKEKFTLTMNGSSCDFYFKVGETYLVYALKDKDWLSGEDRWYTHLCTRTRKIAEAKEDIDRLWSLKLSMLKKP
jgi:hypothetical protein